MIQVIIVDQHQLFTEAIKSILSTEEDIEVVGIATRSAQAIRMCRTVEPDVMLLDLNLPNDVSIETVSYLKENYPNIKIIFLASESPKDLIIAGIAVGGDGLLYKDLEADTLVQSIRDVHRGEVVFSGEVAKILAIRIANVQFSKQEILKRELVEYNIELTHREIEIAVMIMEEMRNNEIAEALHLNLGTVKNYISTMYEKMNINRREPAIEFLRSLFPRYYQH